MAIEQPQNVPDTSEADAKAFIYQHESGSRTDAVNQNGCIGLGQDCNGLLRARCPDLDYECEDIYFTEYMQRRYGSWVKAQSFWLARVPIHGKDVGNWW